MDHYPFVLNGDLEILQYIEQNSEAPSPISTYYTHYIEALRLLKQLLPNHPLLRPHIATLRRIPADMVIEGPPEWNKPDLEKEARYLLMDPDTMPPILVNERNEIEDGNHRFRVARQQGQKDIWCYCIETL